MRPRLVVAVAVFIWLSVSGFFFSYDPDEAAYKIVARGIVEGHWPYRDFFINRQPLTFAWYLPAGFGASIEVERILAAAMIAASIPVVGVLAARWLSPSRELMTVIAYALLLANPLMYVGANTEAFMLLPLTAALVVTSPVAAGALFGIAVMTKLHALVFTPVLLMVWRRSPIPVALAALGVCVAVSAPFVVVWRDYLDANVWFNWSYAQYSAPDRLAALALVQWALIVATLPLWIAAVGAWRSGSRVLWLWAGCGVLSIKASGLEYYHYYLLLMPPVALLAGVRMAHLWHRPLFRRLLLAPAFGIALLVFGVATYNAFDRLHPNPYEEVAHGVGSGAGELYVLGDRSDMYEFAGRQPEQRFFSSIPLIMRPEWGERQRQELLACPPKFLIVQYTGAFPVPWAADVEKLYATRKEYHAGALLSDPVIECAGS